MQQKSNIDILDTNFWKVNYHTSSNEPDLLYLNIHGVHPSTVLYGGIITVQFCFNGDPSCVGIHIKILVATCK